MKFYTSTSRSFLSKAKKPNLLYTSFSTLTPLNFSSQKHFTSKPLLSDSDISSSDFDDYFQMSEHPEVPVAEVAEVAPEVTEQVKPKKEKVVKPKKEKVVKPQQPSRVVVPVETVDSADFGDLPVMDSSSTVKREWIDVHELSAEKAGTQGWIRARVHNVRGKGKTCFIQLRKGVYTAQAVMCAFGNPGEPSVDLVKYAAKIPSESVIEIFGTVVKPENPVESCTQQDAEIQVHKIFVVSVTQALLPFQLGDANRLDPLDKGTDNEETDDVNVEQKDESGLIRVLQKSRLDNRWIDLRTFSNHSIFRIQSRVGQYFRQYFIDRDFTEIHSPKIIPGVSEGGAQVFKLNYFGTECCLAQSPQLYKQMAITSDFGKVFEIGPVFRAEDANTHRHMCEFIGLDFEMEIKEHYHEVLETLGDLFVYIFDQVNENCKAELAAVNEQYPFTPLKYNRKTLVLDFKEARQMIVDAGENMGEFDDPTTPQEKLLGRLVKEKYGVDLYIVDKYPAAIRPFYTMPNPFDKNYTNSYDVFLRGEEITSGAQRIHDYALLAKRAAECGIPLDGIKSYLDSFKYGAAPHGGAGVGLERVVMLFLGLNNIRKTSLFPRVPNRFFP